MSSSFNPFGGPEIVLTVPSTAPQQEIWMAIQLGGDQASLAFNESLSLDFDGPVDGALLEKAWTWVAQRHEALRTCFSADGLTLCVEKTVRVSFPVEDWRSLPAPEQEAKRQEAVRSEVLQPLDLVAGPVFRNRWLRFSDSRSTFILTAHHLFCDGYSAGVLLRELQTAYSAFSEGRTPELPEAPRFSDYALDLNQALQSPEAAEAERHWIQALGLAPEALDLPTDLRRPPERVFTAERVDVVFSSSLLAGLRNAGKKTGVSLSAFFMGTFGAFLSRLSGQTEFAVGMPSAGQTRPGFDNLVGHCVNTLPLPVRVRPEAAFADLAKSVRSAILDGLENQVLSFGNLLQKLQLPRDPSRIPLVPVLFNVDTPMKLGAFGRASARMATNPRQYEAFELFINATETDEGFVLETTFNTSLFQKQTILRWMEDFRTLAAAAVEDPSMAVQDLPILSPESRDLLLGQWSATARPLPAETTALGLFESQVRRTPDSLAVRDGATGLTYRELDELANHWAGRLKALGVAADDLVGVCVDRSVRMVGALLAIWKAGAAYVPLDPDYPKSRLDHIVRDSALKVLMTERSVASTFEGTGLQRLWLDEDPGRAPQAPSREDRPGRLAYVLHTSGSTGLPKGVQIEHGNLVNFLSSMARDVEMGPRDVLVAVTTLSFDIAGLELYLPLSVGAQTVIASREETLDGTRLSRLLATTTATMMQATPATWQLLIDAQWEGPQGFKVLCGGEAMPQELAKQLTSRASVVWNVYGPTETTIWSTLDRVVDGSAPITIGRPIGNTTVYLTDERQKPVPVGAAGELLIGGAGVARGYLNRPDLTAERFLPDPFSSQPGARVYRTGDVCRFGSDGRLHFLRRNDGQVKVRGFRIELGEIETAASAFPGVQQAVAVVKKFDEGDVRLVAYYVGQPGSAVDAGALRAALAERLPAYMVPQHLVALAEFPLTPNGKIDRKALPVPTGEAPPDAGHVEPGTQVEIELAQIWSELLRVTRISTKASFFDLGGHSMLAARMLSRIKERLGVDLPMRTVFQAQTIEGLAARIEAAGLQSAPRQEGPTEVLEF